MKTRLNKILTVITAVTFVAALAINVQASFNDPFAGMSDAAIVQTTSDTSGETTGTDPLSDCVAASNFDCILLHPTDPSKDLKKDDHKWPDPE